MHWSHEVAGRALRRTVEGAAAIGSGISLSGPVHVGHAREFLTAAMVAQAVREQKREARFVAFADDIDPLRKVYPFLGPEYGRWVGCPLNRIPDHLGCHASYAEHFLVELKEAFEALRIEPEILRGSELYNRGEFANLARLTLERRDKVNEILDRVAGRSGERTSGQKWPFMPECPGCYSIQKTEILGWDGAFELSIRCAGCGKESVVDLRQGAGKLIWRCDWPMRWSYLGIAAEPFGHDHNASGGSYESGIELARAVYGIEAPVPVPYAWVHFKSGGAMHSSSGKAISVVELARAYPPEVIWWMFSRRDPLKMIPFDPVQSLFEEARLLRQELVAPTAEMAGAVAVVRGGVGIRASLAAYPYDHLVLAAQLGGFTREGTMQVLRRSKAYREETTPVADDELQRIKLWLDLYGAAHRIRIRTSGEGYESSASQEIVHAVGAIREQFRTVEWEAQVIHNTVHNTAKAGGVQPGDIFPEIYRRAIGQDRGPKVGWLFETLGREKVVELLS